MEGRKKKEERGSMEERHKIRGKGRKKSNRLSTS